MTSTTAPGYNSNYIPPNMNNQLPPGQQPQPLQQNSIFPQQNTPFPLPVQNQPFQQANQSQIQPQPQQQHNPFQNQQHYVNPLMNTQPLVPPSSFSQVPPTYNQLQPGFSNDQFNTQALSVVNPPQINAPYQNYNNNPNLSSQVDFQYN